MYPQKHNKAHSLAHLIDISAEAAEFSVILPSQSERSPLTLFETRKLYPEKKLDQTEKLFAEVGLIIGLASRAESKTEKIDGLIFLCFLAWLTTAALASFGYTLFGFIGLLVIPLCAIASTLSIFWQAKRKPSLPTGTPFFLEQTTQFLKYQPTSFNTNAFVEVIQHGLKNGLNVEQKSERTAQRIYFTKEKIKSLTFSRRYFILQRKSVIIFCILLPIYCFFTLVMAFLRGESGWYNWAGIYFFGW